MIDREHSWNCRPNNNYVVRIRTHHANVCNALLILISLSLLLSALCNLLRYSLVRTPYVLNNLLSSGENEILSAYYRTPRLNGHHPV